MNDDWMLALRDGEMHEVGPLHLRYEGPGEHGPIGDCWIGTEENPFELSWMDGEAIAFCIRPSADLWQAYESDKEPTRRGARRGWLRLKLRADKARLGRYGEWAGTPFQFARLSLNCIIGEKAKMLDGRSRNYRRSNLRKQDGAAKEATRDAFIFICGLLARHFEPDLPTTWEDQARARWTAADQTYGFAFEGP